MHCLVLDLVVDNAIQRLPADIPENPHFPNGGNQGDPIGLRWFRHIIAEAGGETVYHKLPMEVFTVEKNSSIPPSSSSPYDTLVILGHGDKEGHLMDKDSNGNSINPKLIINALPDANSIETVIIWACYSEKIGEKLAKHIQNLEMNGECKIIIQRHWADKDEAIETTNIRYDAGALIRLATIIASDFSLESFQHVAGKPAGWGNIGASVQDRNNDQPFYPLVWMFLRGTNDWLEKLPIKTVEGTNVEGTNVEGTNVEGTNVEGTKWEQWEQDYFYLYQIDWMLFHYKHSSGMITFHARFDDKLEKHFQLLIEILEVTTTVSSGDGKPRALIMLPQFPKIPPDALKNLLQSEVEKIKSTKLYIWLEEVFVCVRNTQEMLASARSDGEEKPIILFAHFGYAKKIFVDMRQLLRGGSPKKLKKQIRRLLESISNLYQNLKKIGEKQALILLGSEYFPAGNIDPHVTRDETEEEGEEEVKPAASIRLPIIQYGQLINALDTNPVPNFLSVKEKIFIDFMEPDEKLTGAQEDLSEAQKRLFNDLKGLVGRVGSDDTSVSVPPRLLSLMRKEKESNLS